MLSIAFFKGRTFFLGNRSHRAIFHVAAILVVGGSGAGAVEKLESVFTLLFTSLFTLGQNRRIAVFSKYKIFTLINIEKLYYRPDIHCRPIDLYYTDALTVVLY